MKRHDPFPAPILGLLLWFLLVAMCQNALKGQVFRDGFESGGLARWGILQDQCGDTGYTHGCRTDTGTSPTWRWKAGPDCEEMSLGGTPVCIPASAMASLRASTHGLWIVSRVGNNYGQAIECTLLRLPHHPDPPGVPLACAYAARYVIALRDFETGDTSRWDATTDASP
jgi:hypothetical protein